MSFGCALYLNGGPFSCGCDIKIYENGIDIINCLSMPMYKLQRDQIIKIIKYNKNQTIFNIEFSTAGAKKSEIIKLRISFFRRKKFIKYIEDMGYIIETREHYKRE